MFTRHQLDLHTIPYKHIKFSDLLTLENLRFSKFCSYQWNKRKKSEEDEERIMVEGTHYIDFSHTIISFKASLNTTISTFVGFLYLK